MGKKKPKKPSWLDKLTDRIFGKERPGVRAKTGPVRENIEAFSVAIMGAVLLKYFAVEAFAIPTSSMQPTLMGSEEADVYDRLLVDKAYYDRAEPQRGHIAVFRYPLQKNQNYVKRIWGLPGDKLTIGGGNVYLLAEDGSVKETARLADDLHEGLWKEVYPLRRSIGKGGRALGEWFRATPRNSWSEDGDALVLKNNKRQASLAFQEDGVGGVRNRVYDGYPEDVARAIKKETPGQIYDSLVQDVRIHAIVDPSESPKSFQMQLELNPVGGDLQQAVFEVADGKGRLFVRVSSKEAVASEPFDFALPAGTGTPLSFGRLNDELMVWRDGELIQRLDIGAARVMGGLELTGDGDQPTGGVRFLIQGGGTVRLEELRIERDTHYYLFSGSDPNAQHVAKPGEAIDVPAGHYFMLGDNTLQSVDSRGWTAITVGVLPDGRMVDPDGRHRDACVRVRGNLRARDPKGPVDRDENPVVVPDNLTVCFKDDYGEIRTFRSAISATYAQAGPDGELQYGFVELDENGTPSDEWFPKQEFVPFVPRKHIVGRCLVSFWPFPPFATNRLGFIR